MGIGPILPLSLQGGGLSETSQDILTQIRNNFINLVLTRKGERFGNPTFGCDIHDLIFNFNDEDLEGAVLNAVQSAVDRWMPYIDMEEVRVNEENSSVDRNRFQVYMKYRLSEQPNLSDEVLIQL